MNKKSFAAALRVWLSAVGAQQFWRNETPLPLLELSLPGMVGMAGSLKILLIKEVAPVIAVLSDVDLGSYDMIDIRAGRIATAQRRDLAHRIAHENSQASSLAPLRRVV